MIDQNQSSLALMLGDNVAINYWRELGKNAPKYCLGINLEKNVFKPFSSLGVCFMVIESLSEYRMDVYFEYVAATFY